MKNQNGYAIVVTMFILAIFTIIGASSMHNSIIESKLATNTLIHEMEFYAADSGIDYSPVWLRENHDTTNDPTWKGNFTGTLDNQTVYDVEITHLLDPSGNVVLWGDEDGDYLYERNSTTGRPFEVVKSIGTHPRKGRVIIDASFQPVPPFVMPQAALWVHSNVNGNGVSGAIVGEGPSDDSLLSKAYYDSEYDCPAVPDIMYETTVHDIEYSGNTGQDYLEQQATGVYPMVLMLNNFRKMADHYVTSISGNKLPDDVDLTGQKVIYIDAGDVKLSQNITGSGILICNGDLEVAGNMSWNGLILVNGHLTMNGGGASNSTMVTGAIVAVGDAVAINGSVDIIYDCRILNDLYGDYYRYKRLLWAERF